MSKPAPPSPSAYVEQPSRVEVLLSDYREARLEGMQLAQSAITDIAVFFALIGAVIGSDLVLDEPSFLLMLPYMFGGLGLYAIQKFRTTSLVTSYLLYLEDEINRTYPAPVSIWTSVLVSQQVSAGRQSRWGQATYGVALAVTGLLYSGTCWWVVVQNHQNAILQGLWRLLYLGACGLLLFIMEASAVSAVRAIRKNSPTHIREVAHRVFSMHHVLPDGRKEE